MNKPLRALIATDLGLWLGLREEEQRISRMDTDFFGGLGLWEMNR